MSFKSDCQISSPSNLGEKIKSRFDMGGFGWHPDHGIFIPVSEPIDYIQEPYPTLNESASDQPEELIGNTPIPSPKPQNVVPAATYAIVYNVKNIKESPFSVVPPADDPPADPPAHLTWITSSWYGTDPAPDGVVTMNDTGGYMAPVIGGEMDLTGRCTAFLESMDLTGACEIYLEVDMPRSSGDAWINITLNAPDETITYQGDPVDHGYELILFANHSDYNIMEKSDEWANFAWDCPPDAYNPDFIYPDGPIAIRMRVDDTTTPATVSTKVWDLAISEPVDWDFSYQSLYPAPGFTLIDEGGYMWPDDPDFEGQWPMTGPGKLQITTVNQNGSPITATFSNLEVTPL